MDTGPDGDPVDEMRHIKKAHRKPADFSHLNYSAFLITSLPLYVPHSGHVV